MLGKTRALAIDPDRFEDGLPFAGRRQPQRFPGCEDPAGQPLFLGVDDLVALAKGCVGAGTEAQRGGGFLFEENRAFVVLI